MSRLNNTNQHAKAVFENVTIEPRDEVWDRIENSLTKKNKKSRVLILLMGTMLILSSIGSGFKDSLKTPDQTDTKVQSFPIKEPKLVLPENTLVIEASKDSVIPEVKKEPEIIAQKKEQPIHIKPEGFQSKAKKNGPEPIKSTKELEQDSLPEKPKPKKTKAQKEETNA